MKIKSLILLLFSLLSTSFAFALSLSSQSFTPFTQFDKKTICSAEGGGNISPQLAWSEVPAGTRSLLLLLHDPDAPHEAGFVHWIVYLQNPQMTSLAEGATQTKQVIFALNGMDENAYMGPCPPAGTGIHRYNFTLYALNTVLDASVAKMHQHDILNRIATNIIAQAVLTGFYSHP